MTRHVVSCSVAGKLSWLGDLMSLWSTLFSYNSTSFSVWFLLFHSTIKMKHCAFPSLNYIFVLFARDNLYPSLLVGSCHMTGKGVWWVGIGRDSIREKIREKYFFFKKQSSPPLVSASFLSPEVKNYKIKSSFSCYWEHKVPCPENSIMVEKHTECYN